MKKRDEQYSPQEAEQRFKAALLGARLAGPRPIGAGGPAASARAVQRSRGTAPSPAAGAGAARHRARALCPVKPWSSCIGNARPRAAVHVAERGVRSGARPRRAGTAVSASHVNTARGEPAFDAHHPPQRALIDTCMHCGFCLPSCPTYVLSLHEAEGPRGRVGMARALAEGNLALTPYLKEHELNCLVCDACSAGTPGPSSSTHSRTRPSPAASASTRMVEPAGEYFAALSSSV